MLFYYVVIKSEVCMEQKHLQCTLICPSIMDVISHRTKTNLVFINLFIFVIIGLSTYC